MYELAASDEDDEHRVVELPATMAALTTGTFQGTAGHHRVLGLVTTHRHFPKATDFIRTNRALHVDQSIRVAAARTCMVECRMCGIESGPQDYPQHL
jgi:hypothetical protein